MAHFFVALVLIQSLVLLSLLTCHSPNHLVCVLGLFLFFSNPVLFKIRVSSAPRPEGLLSHFMFQVTSAPIFIFRASAASSNELLIVLVVYDRWIDQSLHTSTLL